MPAYPDRTTETRELRRIVYRSNLRWTTRSNLANVVRYFASAAWFLLWGLARFIDNLFKHPDHPIVTLWRWSFTWMDRESPAPHICGNCGWVGAMRWALHTHQSFHGAPAIPVVECPRCFTPDVLLPVFGEPPNHGKV